MKQINTITINGQTYALRDSAITDTMEGPKQALELTVTQGAVRNMDGSDWAGDGCYGTTPVTPGQKLQITGFQWDPGFGYYHHYFYDGAGTVLAYAMGTQDQVTTIEAVAPAGAVTLLVNGQTGSQLSVTETPQLPISLEAVYKDVAQLQTDVAGKATTDYVDGATKVQQVLDSYEYPLTIETEQVYGGNGAAVDFSGNTQVCCTKAAVTPGDILQITGFQWNPDYDFHVFHFLDADGAVLYTHTGSGEGAKVTVTMEVPEHAAWLIVNGHLQDCPISVSGMYTETFNMETALARTEELETAVGQLRSDVADKASEAYVDDATRVSKTLTDYQYPLAVTAGKVVYDSGGTMDHGPARYARTAVTPGTVITVSGYQWDASFGFSVFHFLNAGGGIIYTYTGQEGQKPMTVEGVEVPEDAAEIIVNGHISDGDLCVTGEALISVGISELYDEVSALKNQEKPTYKLITLGDSITALGTGSTGWVKYFIEKTGCTLVANTAVNSAVLSDYADTVYDGNPLQSNQTNNVLGNQVQKILNNAYEAPDIIMIAIGTNGGISITKEQIRAAYYDGDNALIPLENVDRTTNAGAYRYCLETLHAAYPDAQIFWCTPIMGYQATRSADNAMNYAESLRIATEYTGQVLIDTIRCGINGVNEKQSANGQYLIDGLHPNANGAKKMGYYNASKVLPFLGNGFALS